MPPPSGGQERPTVAQSRQEANIEYLCNISVVAHLRTLKLGGARREAPRRADTPPGNATHPVETGSKGRVASSKVKPGGLSCTTTAARLEPTPLTVRRHGAGGQGAGLSLPMGAGRDSSVWEEPRGSSARFSFGREGNEAT